MCESRERARDTMFEVLGLDETAWGMEEAILKFKAEPSTF